MESDKLNNILNEHGYSLISPVGRGGFSHCYKVLSLKYKTEFVCKTMETLHLILKNHIINVQQTYKNEIHSLSNVTHSNIIHIYDFFCEGRSIYIILEYCPLGTLLDEISKNGPIKPPKLFTYLFQIASAVSYLHSKSIVHHDINPGNVFIAEANVVKLADFGLSKTYEKPLTSTVRGTMKYLSPEMILGYDYNPFSAEVWAFGVTAYFIAVGKLPFSGEIYKDLKEQITKCEYTFPDTIDPRLKVIINGCLNVDPRKRLTMATISNMLHELIPKQRTKGKAMHNWNSANAVYKRIPLRNDRSASSYPNESIFELDV